MTAASVLKGSLRAAGLYHLTRAFKHAAHAKAVIEIPPGHYRTYLQVTTTLVTGVEPMTAVPFAT
jgi:hypothetical protein